MKKSVLFTSLFVLPSLILAVCDSDSDDRGASNDGSNNQVYTMVESQEIPSTDPSLATNEVSFTTLNNVYEGIYCLDKNNRPAPAGVAEKATVPEGGLIYKIKLREESKWSGGEPATAADYVYSWQRTVGPTTTPEYAYTFEPVKNAEKVSKGELLEGKLGTKATDDYRLEITLETATPYFDDLLASPSFLPQRQDIVERFDKDYTKSSDRAVYNGPFTLTKSDGLRTNTKWSLTKNEEYWDKETVKLDKVTINVMKETPTALNLHETGEVDDTYLSGELAQQVQNSPDLVQLEAASSFYLEINQADEKSPLTNANLRRAIPYAISRDSLAKNILANDSLPSQGFVPVGVAKSPKTGEGFIKEAGSDKLVKYNKKKAVEYWNRAKQELGVPSSTIDLVVDDSEGAKKMGKYLQGSLPDTSEGLKVTAVPVPMAVHLGRALKGDFQIVVHGRNADYSDPINFLGLLGSSTSSNRGYYSNPGYDKFIAASKTTDVNDPERRWEDLINAEKIVITNMGTVPVYQKAELHLRAPNMKEVIYCPTGTKYDFEWMYKE